MSNTSSKFHKTQVYSLLTTHRLILQRDMHTKSFVTVLNTYIATTAALTQQKELMFSSFGSKRIHTKPWWQLAVDQSSIVQASTFLKATYFAMYGCRFTSKKQLNSASVVRSMLSPLMCLLQLLKTHSLIAISEIKELQSRSIKVEVFIALTANSPCSSLIMSFHLSSSFLMSRHRWIIYKWMIEDKFQINNSLYRIWNKSGKQNSS